MSSLPASVRLSLWITAAWSGHVDLAEALRRALPDIDHVDGDVAQLQLWQDLGERVLVCALPRPGDVRGLPRGNNDLVEAATDCGECVFVPGIGGALVPTVEEFGPEGDVGTTVRFTAYDCDPIPTHRLEALRESEIERGFREQLTGAIGALEGLDVQPWAGSTLRGRIDDRIVLNGWGLPPGLPGRALRVLQQAATTGAAADLGLAHSPAVDISQDRARHLLLLDLQSASDRAMADACTVAALTIAGMRGS
ncbi:hypothetical protein [Leekyejoonella antrihumi]|uniref:Uncharacterized protein n=1 Tax=Leekyejoonella antrihumi TaxID=1660198 RepID=A0A563E4N2_9MICO|nr:hypothetical protein [Leekyejoonella antrihumi]TWP37203.1 hypothetical protein FGL98_07270 [Leekyejoonella antrihumi]